MSTRRDGPSDETKQPVSAVVASPSKARRTHVAGLLNTLGIETILAKDVETTLAIVKERAPTVAILQGFAIDETLLKFCRSTQDDHTRIIVISPNPELVDRIIVLELGADEFLCDPTDDRLLTSRLKAVLRRSGAHSWDSVAYRRNAWSVDTLTREAVSPRGARIQLTAAELSLLDLFIRNRGTVVNAELASAAIGTEGGPAFRNATSRLRRKLAAISGGADPIQNFQGIGYVLDK
ncbi:response regulator transcription factor [Roseibacterium beibuensis]|uniref:response regulator transcription factor n=1 Tax=[Roseibacterium] beibuensis TaxID=1193142 RepID=UPI00217EC270|nr:response regulator transcription factor [Roseibacterium beibuensis]MCS6625425.1 response regulator transcription factor [Roseibacterium beibuensis]